MQWALRLRVLGGDFEYPKIAGFQEVFAQTQRCQRSSTQGHERKKRDDEAVAILKRTALMDRVQLLCTIHEFHAERVELVAGHEMKSCRSGRRFCCQALRDRQQP